jgi:Lysyl oxidase
MNVRRGTWIRAAAVVALAIGVHRDAGAGTSGAAELLPDLQMARLYGMELERTPAGRVRLHFGTIGWNLGDGPIEALGRRNAGGDLVMRVIQRIYNAAGGHRDRVTPAVMIYETGDHHDHWHVRQFTVVQMYRRGVATGSVYGLRKIGYCLLDARRITNPPAPSPDERVYRSDACGSRASRRVRTGLSVGYGDDYPPDYAHQWMDITGLRPGVYRICTTIDPLDEFVEKREGNNQRWTDVRINIATGRLRVLGTAIAKCGPHVP